VFLRNGGELPPRFITIRSEGSGTYPGCVVLSEGQDYDFDIGVCGLDLLTGRVKGYLHVQRRRTKPDRKSSGDQATRHEIAGQFLPESRAARMTPRKTGRPGQDNGDPGIVCGSAPRWDHTGIGQ